MEYYSSGKLLISGEYLVLKGAVALAIPLKLGQNLRIDNTNEFPGLVWESREKGHTWFHAKYQLPFFDTIETTDKSTASYVAKQLKIAAELNPTFIDRCAGKVATSNLEFNRFWGFGSSSSLVSNIAWYANLDGDGTFSGQQIISNTSDGASAVFACDLDGDGDHDILSASRNDKIIAWYKNMDGYGTFSSKLLVDSVANGPIPNTVFSCDVDGDGDNDVISCSGWYDNTDGNGTFLLNSYSWGSVQNGMCICDIDGDGDFDVIRSNGSSILWYENTDGYGTFSFPNYLPNIYKPSSIYASDIDNDGDLDLIGSTDTYNTSILEDDIIWYRNLDGNGTFDSPQLITYKVDGVKSVFSCDINGDGTNDVLSASAYDSKVAWYNNSDGNGTFGIGTQHIVTTSVRGLKSISSCDLDGDGFIDILSASEEDNKIAWYKNTDGDGSFGVQRIITAALAGACSVDACDIDGDGDADVISASNDEDKIAWYENTLGIGTFGVHHTIATTNNGGNFASSCDVDGDGDFDILSYSYNKIFWYENLDGLGTFSSRIIIDPVAYTEWGLKALVACDLDGDDDLDVMSAYSSYEPWHEYDHIAWFENIDGEGTFGSEIQLMFENSQLISSAFPCDIDGDGDLDIFSSYEYGKVCWCENISSGVFGPKQVIPNSPYGARNVYASDLDGDGDLDLLATPSDSVKIAWMENLDNNGTFGNQQPITSLVQGVSILHVCDIDYDGDNDVISASLVDDKIAWYENLSPLSVKDNVQKNSISVYPNPTNGTLNVDVSKGQFKQIKISDLQGRMMLEMAITQPNEILDLSHMESGVYLLLVSSKLKTLTTKVIIK